jgi:hypothetical protein
MIFGGFHRFKDKRSDYRLFQLKAVHIQRAHDIIKAVGELRAAPKFAPNCFAFINSVLALDSLSFFCCILIDIKTEF